VQKLSSKQYLIEYYPNWKSRFIIGLLVVKRHKLWNLRNRLSIKW